jgi:hypothetical protein
MVAVVHKTAQEMVEQTAVVVVVFIWLLIQMIMHMVWVDRES